jgi:hypothetical protein
MSDAARFKSVVEDVDIDVTSAESGEGGSGAPARDTPSDADRVPDLAWSPAEVVSSAWAWPTVLAVLVPAVGLMITLLVR